MIFFQVQCVRDTQISDNSLGLASIQDPAGPLRTKDDDLVANTILEKASDWTSPKPLLMALLQRLIQEMSLPFANQVIMAALKHEQISNEIQVKDCFLLDLYLRGRP